LVDVAHDQQGGSVRDRLQESLHQHDVDHGRLVDHQQVALERIVLAAFEAAASGIDLEEPVNSLRLKTGCLSHALGGAASRGAKQKLGPLGCENTQNGPDYGCFADAGAAGHHHDLGLERKPDSGNLALRKGKPDMLFDPGQRLVRIDRGPRKRAGCQPRQPSGDRPFRVMQTRQKYAGRLANPIGDDVALM
jgi:hypothetical protein